MTNATTTYFKVTLVDGKEYFAWGFINDNDQFCPSITCNQGHTTQPIHPASSMYEYCDAPESTEACRIVIETIGQCSEYGES